jgi:hypothetical protein
MKKLFDIEVTRLYTKYTTIVVEAESEQDALDKIEMDKDINAEISKRISDAPLHWDDDSYEIYQVEQEAV